MRKHRVMGALATLSTALVLVGCTGSSPAKAPETRAASCGLGDGSGIDGSLGESIPHLSVSRTPDPSHQFEVRVDSIDAVSPDASKTSLRLAKGDAWYEVRARVSAAERSGLTASALLKALRLQTGSERCFAPIDFSRTDPGDLRTTGSGSAKHQTVALKARQVGGWVVSSTSPLPSPVSAQELRLVFVVPLDDAPNRVFWVNATGTYLGSWAAT